VSKSAFELVTEFVTQCRYGRVPFEVVVDTNPTREVQLVQDVQSELQVMIERVGIEMIEPH